MLKVATLGVALVLVLPSERTAECGLFDIDAAFKEAQAVFVGRVVGTKSVRTDPKGHRADTVATLKVERIWKGPHADIIHVQTCGSRQYGVECGEGINFQVKRSYLVFAYGDPPETSSCTTKLTEDSVDQLLWLASKSSWPWPG